MTVKCLDDETKNFIAAAYREGVYDSEELAKLNEVSKRTIQRVLVERGVNRVRVFKGRKKKYDGIVIDELPAPTLPQPEPQPQPQPPQSLLARLWAQLKFCASIPFK